MTLVFDRSREKAHPGIRIGLLWAPIVDGVWQWWKHAFIVTFHWSGLYLQRY